VNWRFFFVFTARVKNQNLPLNLLWRAGFAMAVCSFLLATERFYNFFFGLNLINGSGPALKRPKTLYVNETNGMRFNKVNNEPHNYETKPTPSPTRTHVPNFFVKFVLTKYEI
jgi:hypothetical protein